MSHWSVTCTMARRVLSTASLSRHILSCVRVNRRRICATLIPSSPSRREVSVSKQCPWLLSCRMLETSRSWWMCSTLQVFFTVQKICSFLTDIPQIWRPRQFLWWSDCCHENEWRNLLIRRCCRGSYPANGAHAETCYSCRFLFCII